MPVWEATVAGNMEDRAWSNSICDGYQWIGPRAFLPVLDWFNSINGSDIFGDGWGGWAGRWTGVPIPQGSTINSANLFMAIQFPLETTGDDIPGSEFRVYGEDVDDALTLADGGGGLVGGQRTYTSAFQTGPGEPFGVYGTESWLEQREFAPGGTGIASIIQEIVNRPGWVAGNALCLILDGQTQSLGCCGGEGQMRWAAYDNTEGEEALVGEVAPRLVVDYTEPVVAGPRTTPIII